MASHRGRQCCGIGCGIVGGAFDGSPDGVAGTGGGVLVTIRGVDGRVRRDAF
ncbi:hypothetical protein [Actinacidiphila glaucinigra]|uniref:hypothetical protein n=1 Tax=Actinacidiphila glaucinigra TaxID=235986 RepID=UPI003D8A0C28